MSNDDLNEFKSDHSGGENVKGAEIMEPTNVTSKKRLADVDKEVDPTADKLGRTSNVKTPGGDVNEAFEALFEGIDLSEEFKDKVSMVFEAAVNEAAGAKALEIAEALEEEFAAKLDESVSEAMEEIVENLDNYLDYVVSEWVSDNEIAIEAGIKVEMAESLIESLKGVFYEHNIEIDEETVDVVADLEEEIAVLTKKANAAINESIQLANENAALHANEIFYEIAEGLTTTQAERLRVLSEKLDYSDLEAFASDLSTLKESFFKRAAPITEALDEEREIMVESSAPTNRSSSYDSINAIVAALNAKNK